MSSPYAYLAIELQHQTHCVEEMASNAILFGDDPELTAIAVEMREAMKGPAEKLRAWIDKQAE